MGLYYSKEGLYREVLELKKFMGLNETEYGMNIVDILLSTGLKLESVPFNTKGLRGMSIVGDERKDDVILLNSKRTLVEQNFDCGHEMMHLALHRSVSTKTFNCFDEIKANQNRSLEWQANEGAAEFLVPYKLFLNIIGDCHASLNDNWYLHQFKEDMSEKFKVPASVINYRLENLKYEIKQYLDGVPISEVKILSQSKQKEKSINVKSLNDIAMDNLNREFELDSRSYSYQLDCDAEPNKSNFFEVVSTNWSAITQELGGSIRPIFRGTVLEPCSENCFCIVFSNSANYAIGSRPTTVGTLEKHIQKAYGKEIYLKTRMKNTCE